MIFIVNKKLSTRWFNENMFYYKFIRSIRERDEKKNDFPDGKNEKRWNRENPGLKSPLWPADRDSCPRSYEKVCSNTSSHTFRLRLDRYARVASRISINRYQIAPSYFFFPRPRIFLSSIPFPHPLTVVVSSSTRCQWTKISHHLPPAPADETRQTSETVRSTTVS